MTLRLVEENTMHNWRPNSTLRLAMNGGGGDVARIAATTTIDLARALEGDGKTVTHEWASATYLGLVQALELRAAALRHTPVRARSKATR